MRESERENNSKLSFNVFENRILGYSCFQYMPMKLINAAIFDLIQQCLKYWILIFEEKKIEGWQCVQLKSGTKYHLFTILIISVFMQFILTEEFKYYYQYLIFFASRVPVSFLWSRNGVEHWSKWWQGGHIFLCTTEGTH